jgi:hypothetical protein
MPMPRKRRSRRRRTSSTIYTRCIRSWTSCRRSSSNSSCCRSISCGPWPPAARANHHGHHQFGPLRSSPVPRQSVRRQRARPEVDPGPFLIGCERPNRAHPVATYFHQCFGLGWRAGQEVGRACARADIGLPPVWMISPVLRRGGRRRVSVTVPDKRLSISALGRGRSGAVGFRRISKFLIWLRLQSSNFRLNRPGPNSRTPATGCCAPGGDGSNKSSGDPNTDPHLQPQRRRKAFQNPPAGQCSICCRSSDTRLRQREALY